MNILLTIVAFILIVFGLVYLFALFDVLNCVHILLWAFGILIFYAVIRKFSQGDKKDLEKFWFDSEEN